MSEFITQPFELFYEGVQVALENKLLFRGELKKLEGTLKKLKFSTVMNDLVHATIRTSQPTEYLIELDMKLRQGVELFQRFENVSSWNIQVWGGCLVPDGSFGQQLEDMNNDIESLWEIIKVQAIVDTKLILEKLQGQTSTPSTASPIQFPLSDLKNRVLQEMISVSNSLSNGFVYSPKIRTLCRNGLVYIKLLKLKLLDKEFSTESYLKEVLHFLCSEKKMLPDYWKWYTRGKEVKLMDFNTGLKELMFRWASVHGLEQKSHIQVQQLRIHTSTASTPVKMNDMDYADSVPTAREYYASNASNWWSEDLDSKFLM